MKWNRYAWEKYLWQIFAAKKQRSEKCITYFNESRQWLKCGESKKNGSFGMDLNEGILKGDLYGNYGEEY